MSTRLPWDRYLQLVESDTRRLASLARRDLEADVPTCPGWTVRDLVLHTAQVFQHKVACTRLGAMPEDWPPPPPEGDPVDHLEESLAELLGLLRERGPESPSATWWPDDQTVGFWYRRMAHEAAVHRVDAEAAFGEITPVATDLAVDGVDEVLQLFLGGDWSDQPDDGWRGVSPDAGAGRVVAVIAGEHSWRVTQYPDRVDVVEGPGEAVATVGGDPSDVMLWLWRRRPTELVEVAGDSDAVTALQDRLLLATQ
ncbi:MAG: maleylpyruvate isomerase family mycothiol-dependent enzyme [Actinomycetes bacterium]